VVVSEQAVAKRVPADALPADVAQMQRDFDQVLCVGDAKAVD